MNFFGYKNISKTIMASTIVLILSNTLLISIVYYNNQQDLYQKRSEELHQKNVQKQIYQLKHDIDNLLKLLDYSLEKKLLNQQNIIEWLSHLKFDTQKNDYLFVYELLNIDGGKRFAKMVLNPNRPDLVGQYLSSEYKDAKGFAFRKKFLEDIKQSGESVVTYTYKKNDLLYEKKVSYFKYYQPLNWIIAKGVYMDDIQKELEIQKVVLKEQIKEQVTQNIIWFVLFCMGATFIAYLIGKKIESIILEKEKKVKQTTKALANFNRNLDQKIKIEVEKNKEQEQILMQKSKFIALGEMISLIAHQWRQPISELNGIILNLKIHHSLEKLDLQMMETKSSEVENILQYMSNTIDDFRDFFKPNSNKSRFYVDQMIHKVLNIIQGMLHEYKIEVVVHCQKDITIHTFQSQFEQVLLNLLTNAKDAMINDNIENPKIVITVSKESHTYLVLQVCDNAKGIDQHIISKIFDPYFTTKDEANGTGLGLYMVKTIVEKNLQGSISVTSSNQGTCFEIRLKV